MKFKEFLIEGYSKNTNISIDYYSINLGFKRVVETKIDLHNKIYKLFLDARNIIGKDENKQDKLYKIIENLEQNFEKETIDKLEKIYSTTQVLIDSIAIDLSNRMEEFLLKEIDKIIKE